MTPRKCLHRATVFSLCIFWSGNAIVGVLVNTITFRPQLSLSWIFWWWERISHSLVSNCCQVYGEAGFIGEQDFGTLQSSQMVRFLNTNKKTPSFWIFLENFIDTFLKGYFYCKCCKNLRRKFFLGSICIQLEVLSLFMIPRILTST